MEGYLGEPFGKMGYGCLRYSPNPIVSIVDSRFAGKMLADVFPKLQPGHRGPIPIVGSISEVGPAEALILGVATPGGFIPPDWYRALDLAVERGLGIVNGLHERLAPRYPRAKSFIWDVRQEPEGLEPGNGRAAALQNRRVLMIGTDMAVGKMTAGLELWREAKLRGIGADFVATGQIGITVTGSGVPLDAVRVDYATGAIEREVMARADSEWIIVEGQGALIHPGSTSTLPLLRGSCATDLILCCRAGQTALARQPDIAIPPLRDYADLYEDLGAACGAFPRPITRAIAVNTFHLDSDAARRAIEEIEAETGLPACDPVRDDAGVLVNALSTHRPDPARLKEYSHEVVDSLATS